MKAILLYKRFLFLPKTLTLLSVASWKKNLNLFSYRICQKPFNCPKGLLCRDPSNFPVRPSSVCRLSVTLSSGHGFCETCMPGTQSAFKTGSVWDILQNMVAATKTIRMSHLTIPWPFPSLSERNSS